MANNAMRRLAMFDAQTGSDILEEIFTGLEDATRAGLPMSAYDAALYKRLKLYEVNSREVYENFYNALAGKMG